MPMPISGVCGDGTALDARILDLIATVIECCEPLPEPAPGHSPTQTVRVLATLRRFLREGTPWRSLRASPNTVHFAIWMAALKSIRMIGCGVRGRKG